METEEQKYLTCERRIVFYLLMFAAGMMGAYTFNLRGGVFCNAQTANFVLMSIAFGKGHMEEGFYYIIPMFAYLGGAILSEILPKYVKKAHIFRWDTYLIAFEIIVVIAMGFIPLSYPPQICQVAINFIASMQYNTFRQAQSIPMATTFCTNHLRQTGIWIVKYYKKRDKSMLERIKVHISMIGYFFVGGLLLTILCNFVAEKAIWLCVVPLLANLCMLAKADLTVEKNLLDEVPRGH